MLLFYTDTQPVINPFNKYLMPIEPPRYNPDGKDHTLSCDPKYSPLIEAGAFITTVGIGFPEKLDENLSRILIPLQLDWEKSHRYQYYMNTMTWNEYNNTFWTPYYRIMEGQKQSVKEKTRDIAPQTSVSNESWDYTSQEPDNDTKRLQNISEFGW